MSPNIRTRMAVGNLPLDTLSSHGSELKTIIKFPASQFGSLAWANECNGSYLPQNPESRPTEKQLISLLKAAESDAGPVEVSITGLVFMVVAFVQSGDWGMKAASKAREQVWRVGRAVG
jgi:hypothetical protein